MMRPAAASLFRAAGRVMRAGRTLPVCTAEVRGVSGGEETLVALMQATMMQVTAVSP
jgi:acyl-coenzyme A thioesterase PaaI-like protein